MIDLFPSRESILKYLLKNIIRPFIFFRKEASKFAKIRNDDKGIEVEINLDSFPHFHPEDIDVSSIIKYLLINKYHLRLRSDIP